MEASFARSILVDAPMAVVAVDCEGAIRSANATAESFFGRALTSEKTVNISALIPQIDVTTLSCADARRRFNNKSRNAGDLVHLRAIRADDGDAFVDVQAASFTACGEEFVTLFVQDVTAVVAAEVAIQELRIQIIYNWRLNSLGEMASMVAHELNQPLSAILNFLDAAKTLIGRPEIDKTQVLKFIGSAEGQTERASDVIQRFRSLMSRDTGFHTEAAPFEVVGEILPILKMHARELGADISVKMDPGGRVCCDRVQVQQVVVNLVRNAMDAPPTGERRRVLISGSRIAEGYRFVVEDNGPGVSDEVAPRLFDPLSSTKAGGMGLGLTICRTIIEAHGGIIQLVPSSLGGAAFAFTLNDRKTDAPG